MTWSRHRLRSSGDFRAVTRRGVRAARSHVVVHLTLSPEGEPGPRVGFVVSKRIGIAVVRNRVTRRLREIFRSRMADLPAGTSVVIRALPGIDRLPFVALEAEVSGALASALRKARRRAGGATDGPRRATNTGEDRRDSGRRRESGSRRGAGGER